MTIAMKDASVWETVKRSYGYMTRVDIIDPISKKTFHETILHGKLLAEADLNKIIQHRINLINNSPPDTNDRMVSEDEILSMLREKKIITTENSIDEIPSKETLCGKVI